MQRYFNTEGSCDPKKHYMVNLEKRLELINVQERSIDITTHGTDQKIGINPKAIAEEIYRYTSGYPYLVSSICKWLDEETARKRTI